MTRGPLELRAFLVAVGFRVFGRHCGRYTTWFIRGGYIAGCQDLGNMRPSLKPKRTTSDPSVRVLLFFWRVSGYGCSGLRTHVAYGFLFLLALLSLPFLSVWILLLDVAREHFSLVPLR